MSRAVNIDATLQEVSACCEKYAIGISVIEPLQPGGTRVVLNNGEDTEKLRRRMKGHVIDGPVVRSSLYSARQPAAAR